MDLLCSFFLIQAASPLGLLGSQHLYTALTIKKNQDWEGNPTECQTPPQALHTSHHLVIVSYLYLSDKEAEVPSSAICYSLS